MKATKIVCTLGPASSDLQIMKDMLAAGMNVARLNCSHGSHEEHLAKIRTFRQAAEELGLPPAILLDTKGPEIRLGTFADGRVHLEKGQQFILYCSPDMQKLDKPGDSKGVYITYSGLAEQVTEGTRVLIDDGKIRMTVKEVRGSDIICEVRDTGWGSTTKGVNDPDIQLNRDFLDERS